MDFKPRRPFLDDLYREAALREALRETAKQGAEDARALAPVDEGTYRDSIDGDVIVEDGVPVARWGSDDPKWAYIEYGTEDTPAFATLRRSFDRVRW